MGDGPGWLEPHTLFPGATQLSYEANDVPMFSEGLGLCCAVRGAGGSDVRAPDAPLGFSSSILSLSLDVPLPPFFHLTHHGLLGLTVALK